jgi:hypothetical protein
VPYRIRLIRKGARVEIVSGRNPSKIRIHQFHRTVAERVRLKIDGIEKPPGIAEFGIYNQPLDAGSWRRADFI